MVSHSIMVWLEDATLDARGVLCVAGWAAGSIRIERVEIIAAGVVIGEAAYRRPRPDVADVFPQFVDAGASGFAFAGVLGEAAGEAETVVVVAHAEGGASQSATMPISRPERDEPSADPLRFHCDAAKLFDDGKIEIVGWAAHLDEVLEIEVRLDGARIGAAQVGGERPDLVRSMPDIPSARRSGFTFRRKLQGLGAGEHEIALDIVTRRGEAFVRTVTASTQIASENPLAAQRDDLRIVIDAPALLDGVFAPPVRRLLMIEGWAVARAGVAAVEAFLDGALVAEATRGVRRRDIAAAYPDWPGSLTSGFAFALPRKMFSRRRHSLRLAARDARGQVVEIEADVELEPADAETERYALRGFVPQAEIDLKLALVAASGRRPAFCALIAAGEADGLPSTLASLREQAYPNLRVGLLFPAPDAEAAREHLGAPFAALDAGEGGLMAAMEELWSERAGADLFFLRLRAGDRLGADALLEFALEILTRPEEDFRYADDLRFDPGRGRIAACLKPEWSPDLLLSTNYIGRAWCAAAGLAGRAGLSLADARAGADYEFALRLSEAAREIGRAPLVLAEIAKAGDDAAGERAAIAAAAARRGIVAGVRETAAPGVYRLRRRLRERGLVSIIIPTIASRGLIETCIKSLRARTAYTRFEIVCVDNIADPASPWKDWLKQNADCVVEYPAPFNWSKLNNLGAEAALGDYLLFLNDDVEAVDPRWLHALLEHAQRREVGVVGPRLTYPDGRIQHAGMFLVERDARHAFRFAEADELGGFGLGAAQRNVASVTGACMLMRRAAFEEVGGFDEGHAIVNNDVDLCLRLWRAGLRVVYTPHASLVHHEMASRAELRDVYDEPSFAADWRAAFSLGDPFFHPNLSRDDNGYAPDLEPARVIVAGRPLLARESVRRILALKLDHVGDFITGLPAIRRLKARFPSAELHVLAPAASAALARLEPAIDEVIAFDFFDVVSQRGALEIGEEEWAALEARLKPYRFDIAVDLRKHTETRDVLRRAGARLTAGFDHRGLFPWLGVALEWDGDEPYFGKRAQVADEYVALAEAVSLACEPGRGFLNPPAPEAALAALCASPGLADLAPGLFERPIVGVHPGAGNVLRQWPPGQFARLIDLIVDAFEVNVALIGAPGEAAIAAAVVEEIAARSGVWSLVGRTSLAELPTLLGALRLFVGNNSGPHHLAAALGTPTIGVHSGVVSAREWGPVGPMAVAIQREMNCGPCYLDQPGRCLRGVACLNGLRPADVFRVCEQMLGPGLRRP